MRILVLIVAKEQEEQTLFRSMLHNFKKGNLILADAMFSIYSLLSYVPKHIQIREIKTKGKKVQMQNSKNSY